MAGKVDLTHGPVRGHLLRMLGPFSIAIIALLSAGIIDMIYLGNLTSETVPNMGVLAVAAVTVAHPLTFLGNSANIGLGAGTMSAVSRALGENNPERARRHGASAIFFAFMIMVVIVSLIMLVLPFVMPFFSKDSAVLEMASSYLIISLPGLVIISIASMSNNILRAGGEAFLPSTIMILGALINIALDPFLIFGWGPFPRMEVQGAALATLIGNCVAAAYGFYLVSRKRKAVDFKGMTIASFKRAAITIGSVGIPAAMTNIIVPVGTVVVVAIIGQKLTTNELAAFGISRQAEILSVGLLYALSACIGAITGQNGGAGQTDRVREAFKESYKIAFYWSTFMALVLAIFAGPISNLFINDENVAKAAIQYFYIVPITIFAYGFVFVSAAGLNALGRPKFGLIYTIIRSLILYIGLTYIGVTLDGLRGAFVGIAIANLISGFIAFGWTMRKVPMSAVKS